MERANTQRPADALNLAGIECSQEDSMVVVEMADLPDSGISPSVLPMDWEIASVYPERMMIMPKN